MDRDDMHPIEWMILTPSGHHDRVVTATHAWCTDAGALLVGEVDDDMRSWQPVLLLAPGQWVSCEPEPPSTAPWQT